MEEKTAFLVISQIKNGRRHKISDAGGLMRSKQPAPHYFPPTSAAFLVPALGGVQVTRRSGVNAPRGLRTLRVLLREGADGLVHTTTPTLIARTTQCIFIVTSDSLGMCFIALPIRLSVHPYIAFCLNSNYWEAKGKDAVPACSQPDCNGLISTAD